MAKTGTLTLRVDQDVRQRSEQVLAQLGISLSGAIDMFLNQVILTQGIPFPVRLPARQLDGRETTGETPRPPLTVEGIADVVAREARAFGAIERVVLFGSFARGEQGDASDIDLRLELSEAEKFSLFDLARFTARVEERCGRAVDALTPSEIRNPALQEAIEREGVVLYERA